MAKNLTLFLHDDDEDDAFLLSEVVNSLNQSMSDLEIDFTHFSDPAELMQRLQSVDFERDRTLVLMDIKMPQEDGVQVLGKIKNNPETRRIPIVMYSSSDSPSDRQRSYKNYANGYIVKDDSFARLSEKINNLIRYFGVTNMP